MDILEALKPTGKANYDKEFAYAMLKGDDLFWYKSSDDTAGAICHVGFQDILRDDWQPYHEKPEIKPEKAGEVWQDEDGEYWSTYKNKISGLHVSCWNGNRSIPRDMIHGQNGWTRSYPPLPDESVARASVGLPPASQ